MNTNINLEKYYRQEVTDCPQQLIIDGKLCNFSLEWDKPNYGDYKDEYCWNARYRDNETHEIVLERATSPTSGYDCAISNLLHALKHRLKRSITTTDGKDYNVVECILYKGEDVTYDLKIDKHYVIRPNFFVDGNGNYNFNVCPMCGSKNLREEPYNTLCEHALAGSKGVKYYCECGYNWDDIEIMS